jgi:signal peptidase II
MPIEYSFTFILAGAVCSVIDKIFWGGSLDFIGLFSWFIFDTKDLFITIGVTIFAVYTLAYSFKNPKAANGGTTDDNVANSTKDDMQLVKDFIGFMGKDVGRLYGKIFGRHDK